MIERRGKTDKITVDRLKPAFEQKQSKTSDVIPRAGSLNADIQSEVAPGPEASERPRNTLCDARAEVSPGPEASEKPRKSYSDAVKTKSVIRPPLPSQAEAFRTRSGRLSKRPTV